jgi:hypothetical protein
MLTQIDTETGSTGGRPVQPRPEDFGLTLARVRVLGEPVSAAKVLENRWGWIGHAAATLIVGVAVYESTQSVAETAFIVFCSFVPYLFAVAILVAAGIAAFSAIWRRFQPDHRLYIEYARALADYGTKFFQWLRQQELWWQTLDGRRFEMELAIVLARLGYDVRRTWGGRRRGR